MRPVGRKRTKSPAWLPKRCYPHRRQILYYPPKGKPIALGPLTDPGACLSRYAELAGDLPRPRTMGDVIDRYLLEVVPTKAPRTQDDYRAYCGKIKHAFGHMRPDEVEITDLYGYHEARRAPVRANREITILGQIYRYAIRWRAATKNPVDGFLFAEERARERLVSSSERRRFAASCPDWLRGYISLKHLTGRRQGEMLKLTLFSEREDGITFMILKKRRLRPLVVGWTPRVRRVWNWLKTLPRLHSSSAIFPSSKGKHRGQPMSARGFKSAWQRQMADWVAAGNARFHEQDLRAATATAAESAERARELLDHESIRTTRRVYRRGVEKVRPLR
jgi:integrase